MDSMSAFMRGRESRGKERKVFDWNRAAQIIKEKAAKYANAGLEGDFEWTGGCILSDGEPVNKKDSTTYLASTWATPILAVDGEEIPCFIMESKTDFNEDSFWPQSALDILTKK